jgi:hypothetical protein
VKATIFLHLPRLILRGTTTFVHKYCICNVLYVILYVYCICILSHIVTSLSLSSFSFCAACQCFKTLYSVFNTCHFIKSLNTTCFGLNWPSSGVKIAVILGIHVPSSLCLPCACSSLSSCLFVTLIKQFLTLEDGQFRPKYVVFKDFIK